MSTFVPESSSDESVAKVVDGRIVAVSSGQASISGRWEGGALDGFKAVVVVPVAED